MQASRKVLAVVVLLRWTGILASNCRKTSAARSDWCGLPEQLSNFQGEAS